MVMTVSMPTMSSKDEYGMPITYSGCQVTLQHRKMAQFGRANQKWSYDPASGFIFAFAASNMDKGMVLPGLSSFSQSLIKIRILFRL